MGRKNQGLRFWFWFALWLQSHNIWSMLRDRAALGRWTRCPVADRKREQISGRSRVGVSKLAASINLKIDRAGNLVGFA
jgi:hypothetical protein